MGRPKQYGERVQLLLVEGTTAAIDSLLLEGEVRLDFIRSAIDAEIAKRTKGGFTKGGTTNALAKPSTRSK
jgi:hypothetical protein